MLTTNDYFANGRWDCSHAFEIETPDARTVKAKVLDRVDCCRDVAVRELAIAIVEEYMDDWSREDWEDQQDPAEIGDLGVDAWIAWRNGWKSYAIDAMENDIAHYIDSGDLAADLDDLGAL